MARGHELTLRRNHAVEAETSDYRYLVQEPLGEGGFGRAYRATAVDGKGDMVDEVCLKVTSDRDSWVTEAYFGSLVRGESRAVQLREFFPFTVGSGRDRRVLYALISEFMAGGTVEGWARRPSVGRWSGDQVRRELTAVLRLLAKLHATGATHRDITPPNVFIGARGKLVLGDFGIAQHLLSQKRRDPSLLFNPAFVPDSLYFERREKWLPSDDLYELGVVALTLLSGRSLSGGLDWRTLRSLDVSPDFREFLVTLTTRRRSDRFADAGAALDALAPEPTPWAPLPRTINGQRVVFTGTLDRPRHEAEQWVRQGGGLVQDDVNGQTTMVVVGRANPLYRVSPRRGTKLHAAYERAASGQPIALIDSAQLQRLCRLPRR